MKRLPTTDLSVVQSHPGGSMGRTLAAHHQTTCTATSVHTGSPACAVETKKTSVHAREFVIVF